MNLKAKLQEQSQKHKVKWEIIEQDYVLSLVLEGFAVIPELKETLVFKGGTALKKMYFGDYRFSQDLDFTVRPNSQISENLGSLIQQACEFSSQRLQSLGENVELKSEPYVEKKPHPEGQKAFLIQARLPWHRDFYTRVYAEFSFQEILLMKPEEKVIIPIYEGAPRGSLHVYPLEEIVAEKMRALLQFAKKLHERGWGRSRVRDYYDLWRILHSYTQELNLNIIPGLVEKKCLHKGISFKGIDDIFQEKLMDNVHKEWESWLADIVLDLPSQEAVISDLRKSLGEVFLDPLYKTFKNSKSFV